MFVKDIEIAQAVASQLGNVGIKATLQPLERARLLAERNEGDYDVTELAWPFRWMPAQHVHLHARRRYPDAKLIPQWGDPPDAGRGAAPGAGMRPRRRASTGWARPTRR